MRLIRFAVVLLLAAAGTLVFATPAQAGGWATTLLDPLPDRLEPGQTYTVGYWVLQHGSHPYDGDLGRTGLRLTDEDGASIMYEGTALAEPAHYAAAVLFSHAGAWQLTGVQGIFADYEIGAATVPGGITRHEIPAPMIFTLEDYWGAIRPPLDTAAFPNQVAVAAPAAQRSGGSSMTGLRIAGLAMAAAVVAFLAMWPKRTRLGLRRGRVDEPIR